MDNNAFSIRLQKQSMRTFINILLVNYNLEKLEFFILTSLLINSIITSFIFLTVNAFSFGTKISSPQPFLIDS